MKLWEYSSVANNNGNTRGGTYLQERIEHLEKVNRETLDALAHIAELADLKTSLNQISDVSIILSKADNRLRKLLDFGHSAFYTFDEESMDLELMYINDKQYKDQLSAFFQTLVDSMHVAKCINGTKPVFATLDNGQTVVILHPLYTSSRVRGLFMGTLKTEKQYIPDALLSVFSVILGNTANMLESFELYGMIRDMNIELEEQIEDLARHQSQLEDEIKLRKDIEANLRSSRLMLEMVMEHIPQYVFWKDTESVYLGGNRNFANAAGLQSTDGLIGKTDHDLPWTDEEAEFFRKVDREVMDNNSPILNLVEVITLYNGDERFVETNKIPLSGDDGDVIGVLGTFQDITDQKIYEEQLTHQAFHDSLTGLPNRALIIERMDRAIHRARRNPELGFAVMLMDLDRFKYVNDSLGHLAGDRLLVELAGRLSDALRSVDTVARLGGDEFAVLLEGFDTAREMVKILRRIMKIVQEPYIIHGSTIHSSASVGVVLGNSSYASPEDILRDADTAMYTIKNRGGGAFKVYTASMRDTVLKTATLQNDLITGLAKDEFVLEYQPIYDITTDKLKGAEALVRWDHPVRGRLSPDEFIPIAEDTGLIVDMGKRILDMACAQAAEWLKVCAEPFYISVNISGKQLRNPTFTTKVSQALDDAKLPPETLALEVTETVLMERADTTLNILRTLKGMGIRLFLDDFGTGYSSLSYLQQFPVDTIKIDRCFVKNLGNGVQGDDEIIKAIMALAQSMNMHVIAEGVEEVIQLKVLKDIQCKLAQGFYYARPMPPEVFTRLLKK